MCLRNQYVFFSVFFLPFSNLFSAFFTLICRKETKHVKTVTDFSNVELRHFSYRLETFGQDILLSVTLFSLRLGFLGISSTPVSRLYHHDICIWFCLKIGPQKIDAYASSSKFVEGHFSVVYSTISNTSKHHRVCYIYIPLSPIIWVAEKNTYYPESTWPKWVVPYQLSRFILPCYVWK